MRMMTSNDAILTVALTVYLVREVDVNRLRLNLICFVRSSRKRVKLAQEWIGIVSVRMGYGGF